MPRYLVALLLVAAPWAAHAQILTGGIAADSASGAPLGCVDVALEDAGGRRVDSMRTRLDGAFQFVVPESGVYRIRFAIDDHEPVLTPPDTLGEDVERLREYRMAFAKPDPSSTPPVPPGRGIVIHNHTPDDAPASPIHDGKVFPRYPKWLRERGVEGGALMQFVVDSTGRVVPGTVRALLATHDDFAKAVRDFLPKAQYAPARRNAVNVCTLLQQPFLFELSPGDGLPNPLDEMMRRVRTRDPLPGTVP